MLQIMAFVVLISPSAWAVPHNTDFDCQGSYQVINANARIAAEKYTRPNTRHFEDYVEFLGNRFAKIVVKAKAGMVWIDAGGGYGIAGLETARKTKVNVNVINSQDYWGNSRKMRPTDIRDLATKLDISLRDIPVTKKRGTGLDGVIHYETWENVKPEHYEILRKRILEKVESVKKTGNFHYNVGFVENVLPRIGKKAQLITDLYGAFFYSADRIKLLDLYYRSLDEKGVAFLRVRDKNGAGVNDVIFRGKKSQDLVEHLVERHGDIFSLDPDDSNVLIMRKKPGKSELNLARQIRREKTQMAPYADTSIPDVEWRITRSP